MATWMLTVALQPHAAPTSTPTPAPAPATAHVTAVASVAAPMTIQQSSILGEWSGIYALFFTTYLGCVCKQYTWAISGIDWKWIERIVSTSSRQWDSEQIVAERTTLQRGSIVRSTTDVPACRSSSSSSAAVAAAACRSGNSSGSSSNFFIELW